MVTVQLFAIKLVSFKNKCTLKSYFFTCCSQRHGLLSPRFQYFFLFFFLRSHALYHSMILIPLYYWDKALNRFRKAFFRFDCELGRNRRLLFCRYCFCLYFCFEVSKIKHLLNHPNKRSEVFPPFQYFFGSFCVFQGEVFSKNRVISLVNFDSKGPVCKNIWLKLQYRYACL